MICNFNLILCLSLSVCLYIFTECPIFSDSEVLPLTAVVGAAAAAAAASGGVLPPLSSLRSAKSRRPRVDVRRGRPSVLERDDDSQSSLELDEPDEERARAWPDDLTGAEELKELLVLLVAVGRAAGCFVRDLDGERDEDDDQSLNY